MKTKNEEITLKLLKELTEQVMKLKCASKFQFIYKTLISLFLSRSSLDETSYVILVVKELNRAKDELIANVSWEETGTDIRAFNFEIGSLIHEFVKLGTNFVVADGYTEDSAKIDEIWMELRRAHDSLLNKKINQEVV